MGVRWWCIHVDVFISSQCCAVGPGRWAVEGHPQLPSEFEASLGYRKPWLGERRRERNIGEPVDESKVMEAYCISLFSVYMGALPVFSTHVHNLRLLTSSWAAVAHYCNLSTLGGRGRWISEFETSLVYRVSSRTARAIQRNPVSKKPNPKNQK